MIDILCMCIIYMNYFIKVNNNNNILAKSNCWLHADKHTHTHTHGHHLAYDK